MVRVSIPSWRVRVGVATLCILPSLVGCLAPRQKLAALATQNRNLQAQNDALAAKVKALDAHAKATCDKLLEAERNLALAEDRHGLSRQQLANLEQEREFLHGQVGGLISQQGSVSAGLAQRLAWLSRQSGHLSFDNRLGVAKLDTDFLFDTGNERLKPGAERVLADLSKLLNRPEARDFRVLIVGHTDDQQLAGAGMRNRFEGDNFRLSTSRAHSVRQRLELAGLNPHRIGVAGYGPYQPVVPNTHGDGRGRNRRVEVFVIAPTVPVVGWTETTPFLY